MAEADPTNAGTILRNVSPDEVEIIGERDGITYGQWKGGPAGTLNIEFDWRFAQNVGPMVRASMERAGKSWSYRLLDDFGTHVVPAGTTIVRRPDRADGQVITETFDEKVSTDGMFVAMLHATMDTHSSGGPTQADITEDDYEPWFTQVALSQDNIDERQSDGNYWFIHVLAHELGHAIGITSHEGGWNVPSVERYINRQDHTFEGPQSRIANGGQAVPFQWLDANRRVVPPNTPGATVDYAHLGVCSSIMAYCVEPRQGYKPSELDFAFLDDIGYDILDAETASDTEVYGYGAWGQYSAWGAGVERFLGYDDQAGMDISEQDELRAGADAIGISPTMTLAELHASTPQGRVTWTGSLIGVDMGSAKLPPVFGDAELGVDLATLDGTAQFENLTVHVDGEATGFRASRIEYDISVTGNSFIDDGGRLVGSFYGPAHEEMAGVLNDRAPDINLLAGFGGIRETGN
ncbi:MAG: hypothetical protein OXB94_04735 [Nitrospira sp.]|nr:hypothetical protein [Nitrospira sp.]